MYALRYNDVFDTNAKAAPNALWRMKNIGNPTLAKEAGYVTPNVNTIYGFGFLDLRQEPVIVEVPNSDNLYYMVEVVDMWTNAFAYIGGKTTGYKGGKFALTGPNWHGSLPKGVKQIHCPTPWVLIQPRVHVYKDQQFNLELAQSVLNNIKVIGLNQYLGKHALPQQKYNYPAPEQINSEMSASNLQFKDPLQFWKILSLALNENPPPQEQINTLMPLFKSLGLVIGKPWDTRTLPPEVVNSMKKSAADIDNIIANLPSGNFFNGAFIPPETIGNSGTDFRTRAIVARLGLTANIPNEAIYWYYKVDSSGQVLNGSHDYTLTYKQEIPYVKPGFWSISMYDSTTNYTITNPINRYMLGSDTPLKKNSDGSITIYIQKNKPDADKQSNWLPAPAGDFYLIPRVYAPKSNLLKELIDNNALLVPPIIKKQ